MRPLDQAKVADLHEGVSADGDVVEYRPHRLARLQLRQVDERLAQSVRGSEPLLTDICQQSQAQGRALQPRSAMKCCILHPHEAGNTGRMHKAFEPPTAMDNKARRGHHRALVVNGDMNSVLLLEPGQPELPQSHHSAVASQRSRITAQSHHSAVASQGAAPSPAHNSPAHSRVPSGTGPAPARKAGGWAVG